MSSRNLLLGLFVLLTLVFASAAIIEHGQVATTTETTTVYTSPTTSSSTTGSQTQTTSSSAAPPSTVMVFGLVSTVGQGTHVASLTFTNTETGANYTAPMSNGGFSVDVPNQASYDVRIYWVGNYSWQSGVEDRGALTVNMTAGSMAAESYDVQFETPPTVVGIIGTVAWTISSAQPVRVVYTASDGETFQAAVQNGTFITRLPNMMTYHVKVYWQYSNGTSDYYVADDLTVSEGIGVVALDVVIS